jgi:hypothetical protein
VVVASSAPARDARAEVLVLDACVGECSEEDLRLIGAFRRILAAEFKRPGLISSASDVAAAIGYGLSRSAVTNPWMTSQKIIDDLKSAIEHWIAGRYEQAAERAEEGLSSAKLNPSLVTSEPTLRQLIPRVHVARAVSLWRLGRRELARAAISELVRTLPEQSILDSSGTEADKIFQLARKDYEARGKGFLIVEVDDPSAIFYLNEAGQPHRSMFAGALYPGTYRILVQDARGRSRLFLSVIEPNETSMLRIRWRRDSQVTSSGVHVGFVFESEAERVNEGDWARDFASLVKSDLMVVVGRIRWRKRAAMIGTIYSVSSGSAHKVGVVSLTGDERKALRELATFLFSPSKPTPSVTPLAVPPWEAAAAAAAAEAGHASLGIGYPLGWALSGAALGAGAVLMATERDGAGEYAGYALAGAGLVAAIATTAFYLRRSNAKAGSMPAVAVTPARDGLFAGVSLRF